MAGALASSELSTAMLNMEKGRSGNLRNKLSIAERFPCTAPSINMDQHHDLMDFLPKDYQYHVCSYKAVSQTCSDNVSFEATLRMSLQSKEEILVWLKSMQVTWRVAYTRPAKGRQIIFKTDYRCQHNTKPKRTPTAGRVSKNTDCPAKLKVTLVRTEFSHGQRSRNTDPHIPDYPTIVHISNIHNHNIHVADAVRHRDVGSEAVEKLTKLFEAGHSPSSALDVLKYDLQVQCEDDYIYTSADRSICPDLQFCYRLYQQIFSAEYGSSEGKGMLDALERQIALYNSQCSSECARVSHTEDGRQFIVAVCSPLMKRVHAGLKRSGEMAFMDASGNMDRQHCRVFLLLTHSCAGGLPLGIIITQSEEENVIFQGLESLKSLLSDDAFSGRGMLGPQIVITDDSRAERQAIHRAFPEATLLLCSFHLLQAVWRWLWNKNHSIQMADRQGLFTVVKQILYAREESEAEDFYQQALQSVLVNRYNNFRGYLITLYGRKQCWALCYRAALPVRGNHTNNYAESAMRILKDKILHRTKAFNVPQLFDFLTTRLNAYYEARITDAAIGQWDGLQKSRFLIKNCDVRREDISQIDETSFEVKSTSTPGQVYIVDMNLEMCSCPVGSSGAPCKHQAGVMKAFPRDSCNFLPVTSSMRARLLQIATGSDLIHESFLKPLRNPEPLVEVSGGPPLPPQLSDHGPETTLAAAEVLEGAGDPDADRSWTTPAATEELENAEAPEAVLDSEEWDSMMRDFSAQGMSTEGFRAAASAMMKTYHRLKGNPSMLQSAMHMFGRYGSTSLASQRSLALRRVANRAGPSIAAQPTSVARRKVKLGGRRRLTAGRPKKSATSMDHRYSFPKGVKSGTHSLAKAVEVCRSSAH